MTSSGIIFQIIKALFCAYILFTGYNANAKEPFSKGYLLVQDVETYNRSKFGAISTVDEAEKIFSAITRLVNGVEFATLFYSKADIDAHCAVGEIAKKYNLNLWATSLHLLANVRAFGNFPSEYQAWFMDRKGKIKPAFFPKKSNIVSDEIPILDVMNPDAVEWLIQKYRTKYLEPCMSLLNGFFFNEDVIPYMGKSSNDYRYNYWNNASYSLSVLQQWKEYCKKNRVIYKDKIVDKFPVHHPKMVAYSSGMTAYFPGYDIPERILPGQAYVQLPRAKGVWQHWYNFISKTFIDNWIVKLASAANLVNKDNPDWMGVIYFGLHQWLLPYEDIKNPDFKIPWRHRWGAWGRQRGLDLSYLAQQPDITAIICETYPPTSDNLEQFIQECQRIISERGKLFGLMLHRDDRWPLDLTEEEARWRLIQKYQPVIIARYPLNNLCPGHQYYRKDAEELFNKFLQDYRGIKNK